MVNKNYFSLSNESINGVLKELFVIEDETVIDEIRNSTNYFTPAAYKSLIQKIIRFRPDTVSVNNKTYNTLLFLCVSCTRLLQSPGSFVPDIQRYVSGLESAAKRIAVSIFEDSYTENYEGLLSLLSGALLAQRAKTWSPTSNVVKKWLETAMLGYENTNTFKYNISSNFTKNMVYINLYFFLIQILL